MDIFAAMNGTIFALIGAGIAAGLGNAGSGMGVGIAGQAAGGVLAEDPSKFGQTLLLMVLPSSQGIYGLLFAFLVMNQVNWFGGDILHITMEQGLMIFASALPITFTGYFTGIGQGRASAGAIGTIAKRPEELGKAILYPAMVETFAVFGLLISILMLYQIPIG